MNPKRIIIVDIKDKSDLAESVGADYFDRLSSINLDDFSDSDRLVIIDATTHHDKRDEKAVSYDFVKLHDSKNNIFIDYNMFVNPEEYRNLKTNCAIGSEYVAYTNYIMSQKIIVASKEYGIELSSISKTDFDKIVKNSLIVRERIEKCLQGS